MKKRRSGRAFRYKDCDALARYLHEQSLLGWHFKEFRFGLVFEQGAPADIYYAVEIFPEATEMDTRPEMDTEEYAEYCDAAGWKLLDSSRKFCVFRRTKNEAVPIVEPEERFTNIQKAEWLLWLRSAVPVFLLSGLYWCQLLTWNFKNWIFNDPMLLVLLFMASVCMERILEGACLLFWSFTRRRMLKAGNIPVYGQNRAWRFKLLLFVLYFFPVFFFAFHPEQSFLLFFLITVLVLVPLLLVTAWISFYRPSRYENWLFQIAAGIGIFAFISVVMITVVLSFDSGPEAAAASIEEFPLIQADYRRTEGEISEAYAEHMEGILGSKSYFFVSYHKEGPDDIGTDTDISDNLWYTIYQSSHPWILDRLWKDEIPESEKHPEDRTEAWNAVSAAGYTNTDSACKELVRYPGKILIINSDERLDDRQIEIIRDILL